MTAVATHKSARAMCVRVQRATTAVLLSIVASGCSWIPTTSADRTILDTPDVVEASGTADEAAFGVHFIRSISLLRGARPLATYEFRSILTVTAGKWALEFFVPVEALEHDSPMDQEGIRDAFRRTADILDAIFAGSSGRRFDIYLVPWNTSFDGTWWALATRDQDVILHFAYRQPHGDASLSQWQSELMAFLAHEYSHSYFWFHPKWFHTAFADEVVAYSVQRCVQLDLTRSSEDVLNAADQGLVQSVDGLTPAAVYERYRGSYPDTYLGMVVADVLFRRFIHTYGRSPTRSEIRAHCARIVRDASSLDVL